MVRNDDARIEPGARVMRHLPGDIDKVVANDRRDKARGRRGGDAGRVDLADLVSRLGHHRDQRGRDGRPCAEAPLHDHRGARRDVVPERVVPGEVIGRDRARVRIILVEPDGMREIGAEFAEHLAHAAQHEIGLTAARVVPAVSGEPGKSRDGGIDGATAPIEGFVAGQEDPRPGFYGISIGGGRSGQVLDRFDLNRHALPPFDLANRSQVKMRIAPRTGPFFILHAPPRLSELLRLSLHVASWRPYRIGRSPRRLLRRSAASGMVPIKQLGVQDVAMTGQSPTTREEQPKKRFKLGNPFHLVRDMGLTGRLFLLVFIAVLPAMGIQAYNEYDLRAARTRDIQQQVVQITKQFGEEMGELREGARQLLVALGQAPTVKRQQAEACNVLFASTKENFVNYALLGAADSKGNIFCASESLSYSSVADQPFFKRAIATEGLAVGNYWKDPVTGKKMIHFAERFHDPDGKVAGIVFAGLDLDWLSQHLKERGLSPTASILIADREGNIIARLPHPETLVGKNMRRSHEAIMDGNTTGTEESKGVDGIVRIFGYLPASLPPYDLFLSAGMSKAEAFAPIDAASARGISLILLGLVLALYAAWLGGRLFIRRPIDGLLQAATEWSNGNYEARTQIKDTGSEIGRLGSAFNRMAAAVSARYAAQKRAEEELRQLNMTLEERVAQRTKELADANRELAAARDQAESANAAKTAFLAAMSHELRTPLNAIVGFSELITQEVYGPIQKKYVEFSDSILSAGQRMSDVVGDVLTIAQLEAGTFELA